MCKEKRWLVLVALVTLLNISSVIAGTMKLYGNVDGEIYPEKSTDSQVTKNFEDLYVWIKDEDGVDDDDMGSSPYTTDSSGNYDTGWISNIGDSWPDEEAEVYIQSFLRGHYVELHNDDLFGGEDEHSYYIGHLNTSYQHNWNWDNDASDEEQNLFYHVNEIHDYYQGTHNYNMNYDMVANYNAGDTEADGTDIYFSNDQDYALSSDTIYHEYTHNVVSHLYDGWISNCDPASSDGCAMDEAFPDYFAATINDDSDIGEDVGITRNLNNNYQLSSKGTDEYYNSQIFSGGLWNTRVGLGESITDNLVFQSLSDASEPDAFEEFFNQLLEDDDSIYGNGNLNDNTPHAKDIWQAFDDHGMDYYTYVLLDDTPLTTKLTTGDDSYDKFKFSINSDDFAIFGVNPGSSNDYEAKVYSDSGFSNLVGSSTYGTGNIDFVVANGHTIGSTTYYGKAQRASGSGDYKVETENDIDSLTLDTSYGYSLSSSEVLDLFEVYLPSGYDYQFEVDPNSGLDVEIFLFGATGGRGDRLEFANSYSSGGEESFEHTSSSTKDYALVVTNKNGGSDSYNIRICQDTDGDGYYPSPCGDDCNDNNTNVHPGASENNCNGVNDDCDGGTDEDYQSVSCGQDAQCDGNTYCSSGNVYCDSWSDDCDTYKCCECDAGTQANPAMNYDSSQDSDCEDTNSCTGPDECSGLNSCTNPNMPSTYDCGTCVRCDGNGNCNNYNTDNTDPDSDCSPCYTCDGSGSCENSDNGTDVKNDCTESAQSNCGYDGYCDGSGSCRYWDTSILCNSNYLCSNSGGGNGAYNSPDYKVPSQGYCDGGGSCDYSLSTPNCNLAEGTNQESTGLNICADAQTSCTDTCSDSSDNDNDSCADSIDSDCGGTETDCEDSIDNDCDGNTDDYDVDCVDNPPAVTLVSPSDNYESITGSVVFNCSATDDFDLDNITLYHDIDGFWVANQTVTLSGTSDSAEFTIDNIGNGTVFSWNCLAYDNASQEGWGDTNYTVNVSLSTDPDIIKGYCDAIVGETACDGGSCWNFSFPELPLVENTYNQLCCGDDQSEYYINTSGRTACCYNENASVDNYGKCYVDGRVYKFSGDYYKKTLNYTQAENKIVFLRIPKNAFVTSASLNITAL